MNNNIIINLYDEFYDDKEDYIILDKCPIIEIINLLLIKFLN